mmetsp:Transcript_23251/g.47401  ORF Transcript_23251/g.47401 Transcript_23251/m.47401 type:complete len:135 (-) Transcript_23251:543-947(-)
MFSLAPPRPTITVTRVLPLVTLIPRFDEKEVKTLFRINDNRKLAMLSDRQRHIISTVVVRRRKNVSTHRMKSPKLCFDTFSPFIPNHRRNLPLRQIRSVIELGTKVVLFRVLTPRICFSNLYLEAVHELLVVFI